MIADLRLTAAQCLVDQRWNPLIRERTAPSPRFAELWACGPPEPPVPDYGRHKVIDYPTVGHIALECDTLVVASDDLRITIYTAEPDTVHAERLDLAIVLGTQTLID